MTTQTVYFYDSTTGATSLISPPVTLEQSDTSQTAAEMIGTAADVWSEIVGGLADEAGVGNWGKMTLNFGTGALGPVMTYMTEFQKYTEDGVDKVKARIASLETTVYGTTYGAVLADIAKIGWEAANPGKKMELVQKAGLIAIGVMGEIYATNDFHQIEVAHVNSDIENAKGDIPSLETVRDQTGDALSEDWSGALGNIEGNYTISHTDAESETKFYELVREATSPAVYASDGTVSYFFESGGSGNAMSYDDVTVAGGVTVDLAAETGSISGSTALDYFNGAVDSITGTSHADTFISDEGAITFTGGGGNDTYKPVYSSTGAVTITDFDLGHDQLDFSKLGAFSYNLQNDATEASGTTTLHFQSENIILTGITKTNLFNPTNAAFTGLIGGTAGNNIVGSASGDTLAWSPYGDIYGHYTTSNNDTITGNGGADNLNGGGGNDLYIWNPGDGNDTIGENEGETNVLRMQGVTSDQFYLRGTNNYPYYDYIRYSTDGGTTVSAQISITNMNTGTSATELRYIQLDDRVYDTHEGMTYRAIDTAYGETLEASPWYNANDTMIASVSDADTLYGYGGNDSIVGGGGANSLYGGNGDDTITGGTGADNLFGDANNDTLDGGTGNDGLYGGAGNDTYVWHLGDGNDNIGENESETNTIRLEGITSDELYLFNENGFYYRLLPRISTDGGTTVNGSITVNYQNSGTANTEIRYLQLDDRTFDLHGDVLYRAVDTAYGERIDASPFYNGNDTMEASASDADTLYGYGGNDSIVGGGGANSLWGGNGNDAIIGAAGADNLYGEANDDTLNGGTGNDGLFGGAGNDTYIWHLGDGNDNLSENESETNTIRLEGITSDELYLFNENSFYYRLLPRISTDGGSTVNGSITVNYQNSGTANTEIRYLVLDDHTYDTHGDMLYRAVDTAYGERIDASPFYNGNDTMEASASDNDTLYGYGGNDSIVGGGGANSLFGGDGADTISGGSGGDNLNGEAGADSLRGGDGGDGLNGGDGNDTLNGDAGSDTLVGGNGDDTYVVLAGEGSTLVYDYSGSNVIDLHGAAYTYTNSGDDRTLTLTGTGETVWIDDYNLHSGGWSII